jgi:hypothetical protein
MSVHPSMEMNLPEVGIHENVEFQKKMTERIFFQKRFFSPKFGEIAFKWGVERVPM